MKYLAYPNYKPSAVEWIGEIPTHWEAYPVRRIAQKIQTGTTPPTSEERFYEDGIVPWFGPGSFDERITLSDPVKFLNQSAFDEGTARLFKSGATMVVTIGATVGKVSSLSAKGSCNQQITVIEFDERRVFPRFGTYQLKRLEPTLRGVAPSATLPILAQSDIGDFFVNLPPLAEQRTIADFLDTETAKLDTLVAKKRELIKKLKEKRTALISRTVTRGLPPEATHAAGLNPNPKLKPSGIEWLGEIPEHWEVVQLFRVATTIQTGPFGSQLHQSDYVDGGVPLINPSHLIDDAIVPDDQETVTDETARRLVRHCLMIGDVVFARRGDIGRCAVVGEKERGWLCGTGSMVVSLSDCDAKYYARVFRSSGFSALLTLNAVGTTMLNLNPSIVGRMRVPLPPLSEQLIIANYLDSETQKIDRMVEKVAKAIERLQEYRTALITAAVTGKIDVRGYARRTEAE